MSTRLSLRSAALALALCPAMASAQDDVTADTVVATVNGVEITAGHLILMRAQLGNEYANYPDNILYDGLLGQAVQQALLAGSVEVLSDMAQLALDNETRSLLAAEAMQQILDGVALEDAIEAAYQENYAETEPEREYNASHILVATEEEAAEVAAELEAGADFAALARERSTGPTGPNGGLLGWFQRGAMVAPFEEAVVSLEAGQVSAPVQTEFGWHVILLNETRVPDVPPLEQVRDELRAQVQRDAIEARLTELEGAAEVERTPIDAIDPGFLSNPTLLQQ